MICTTCNQPIRDGEPSINYHRMGYEIVDNRHKNPADCVAAAVRRCAEIFNSRHAGQSRDDINRMLWAEFGITEEPKP